MADDADLRRRLTEIGVDVGPITDSTRALYTRLLRKRQNETRASAMGSAAKKLKPSPATRVVKAKAVSTKPRRNRDPEATRVPRKEAIRVKSNPSRMRPVQRPSFTPPLARNSPPQQGSPPPAFSPRIYPILPPLTPSLHIPTPSSPTPEQRAQRPLSPSSVQRKRSNPSSSAGKQLQSPPQQGPSSATSSAESSSGVVTTFTGWLGSRVKGIIGRIQEAASPTPRRPLGQSKSDPTPSAPPKSSRDSPSKMSVDSVSVDQLDFAPADPGSASPGPVYLQLPSPPRGHAHQPHPQSRGVHYDWELQPEDVQICKKAGGELWLLGKGGCGQVYRGLKDGVDDVAVKVIRLGCDPRPAVAGFKQEIDTISRLRHRHVLQFYGACIQPSCLFMVTELMDTDLFSALREQGSRYTWSGEHGKEVLVGIASGMNHLHSRRPPIVHRDIKSPNILVMGGLAKIADVGIANTMAATDMTAQRGFTIAWAAPEVILRKRANEKIDVWSFGIILWEVVTGRVPRAGQLVFPSHAPRHLQSLYTRCTSDDPSCRPSAADIIHTLK